MSNALYRRLLNVNNVGPGAALATSASLTDVSAAPQFFLPANYLQVGDVLKCEAVFTASNTGTPTLLAGLYYGGVAGVALAATSAITTTTAMTNWPWRLRYTGHVRSVGATGSIMGGGEIWVPTSLTAGAWRPIPETALAVVTIDTTTTKALTVGAQWGTSSASNTLTVQMFTVENLA
jgi:hypothetical protein